MTRAEELIAGDFEPFVRKVFSTLNPGQTLGPQPYVRHLCRALQPLLDGEENRLVVNLPPRHLKTVIVSIALSAWHLAHHPSDNIIVVAYSDKLAADIAYHIRRVLGREWFTNIFPTRIAPDRGSVSDFATVQGGGVYAVSISGSITGRGANLIIFDDPLNIKDADNDAIREALNAKFDDIVLSRLNNPANDKFVFVGHRLHEDDLSGMLLARGYHHICLPFIASEDTVYGDWRRAKDSVLRPDAFDAAEIARIKASPGFDLLYQQGVGTRTTRLLPEDFGRFEAPLREKLPIVLSVDANQRPGARNSFAVVQVWASSPDGRFFLRDQWRAQASYDDLELACRRFVRQYSPAAVVIERAANGDRLVDAMSRNRDLEVIGVQPNQRSKAACLAEQIDLIKSGRVHLPAEGDFVDEYLAEFTALRRDNWDQIDATVQYLAYMQTKPSLRLPREWGRAYVVNARGPVHVPNGPARIFSRH